MSASQQAPDLQSMPDVPLATEASRPAMVDGEETRSETVAPEAPLQLSPHPLPEHNSHVIVERDALSDDLQPMLDLRFPDEPQAEPLEVGVHDVASRNEDPASGVIGRNGVEIALAEPALDEATGRWSALHESRYEASTTVGANTFGITEAPALGSEKSEGSGQPGEEPIVALQPADDPAPGPDLHIAAVDATTEDQPPALEETTAEPADPPPVEHDAHDTAAQKIAAEASATAEALENLKRLLAHKMPVRAPDDAPRGPPFLEPSEPPALQARELSLSEPDHEVVAAHPQAMFSPPVSAPKTYHRRRSFEFRSFLAGFALSWALGAVLYVYLILA